MVVLDTLRATLAHLWGKLKATGQRVSNALPRSWLKRLGTVVFVSLLVLYYGLVAYAYVHELIVWVKLMRSWFPG